jgi:uncharacterized membrane protein
MGPRGYAAPGQMRYSFHIIGPVPLARSLHFKEHSVTILILALLIGVIAGLRAITAPAVVSWGAYLGWISLAGTHLAFLGSIITVIILTLLAIGEIINDKRPGTPSRTVPPQFITRVVTGAFAGCALGLSHNTFIAGCVAGAIGAVIGTLGGAAFRGALAKAFGKDLPAALIEDAIAIGGGLFIVSLAR